MVQIPQTSVFQDAPCIPKSILWNAFFLELNLWQMPVLHNDSWQARGFRQREQDLGGLSGFQFSLTSIQSLRHNQMETFELGRINSNRIHIAEWRKSRLRKEKKRVLLFLASLSFNPLLCPSRGSLAACGMKEEENEDMEDMEDMEEEKKRKKKTKKLSMHIILAKVLILMSF